MLPLKWEDGKYTDYEELSELWSEQVRKLEDVGVMVIAAAGNNGWQPGLTKKDIEPVGMKFPGALSSWEEYNVVAVGAVSNVGRYLTWTSPEGGAPKNWPPAKILVWAQGDNIRTLDKNGRETGALGTSFSAPMVVCCFFFRTPSAAEVTDHDSQPGWTGRLHVGLSRRILEL